MKPDRHGQTWLACAVGRQAARLDHSILYLRMPRLFEDLGLARLDGRFHSSSTNSSASEERYRRESALFAAQIRVAL
jgi:hypothetical protein